MRLSKPVFYIASALVLASCGGASKIAKLPLETTSGVFIPKTPERPTEDELKTWPHQDLLTTGYPGISLQKAYDILKGRKSEKVIVGVIDSGIDINHEDLKSVIWTNPKEIPGNGIDDDKNGYVDDIHGWNFLGDIAEENLEFVRIIKSGNTSNPDYQRALEKYEQEVKDANESLEYYGQLEQAIVKADQFIKNKLGKSTYTIEDLQNIAASASDRESQDAVRLTGFLIDRFGSVEEGKTELSEGKKHYETKLKFHLNKDANFRAVLKDNPNDINDRSYGNNNVIGPVLEGSLHGTHVAGIIGAVRNNGIGMDGVADNVAIMAVRAVPDGDENDKDVALAIRYAVDNGAKVINTSFGKAFSPNKQWVYDAIKYAASKDVLIVNAAGNDSKNIDVKLTFPDDNVNGVEYVDNMITIGALNYDYSEKLIADFSNYGKNNVDIFSPGVKIYSTVPGNKYKFLQGTSMASPEVAGIAALIRSYFPKLKASEVKQILMESGVVPYVGQVIVGEEQKDRIPFSNASKSGRIVNAYNAVILAAKKSK
jgi:peptidase S8 and S53, subtilisin, kexin, sedolisin